jgi:hypothetical protein
MLKLNGGLGTGMGLEKAKSLLEIKDGNTFLDFIAKQVEHMRSSLGVDLSFMLMNSFATSEDTLAHLAKYDGLAKGGVPLEFCQNKVRHHIPLACDRLAGALHPRSPASPGPPSPTRALCSAAQRSRDGRSEIFISAPSDLSPLPATSLHCQRLLSTPVARDTNPTFF